MISDSKWESESLAIQIMSVGGHSGYGRVRSKVKVCFHRSRHPTQSVDIQESRQHDMTHSRGECIRPALAPRCGGIGNSIIELGDQVV